MLKNHRIYIVGFMGSGKTTTGKKLASFLGWSFTDLDKKIEEFTGKSISEIFEQDGEKYFRDTESDLLRKLNPDSFSVISTGGGAPCHDDNMDYMLHTGLTVYLKLTPGELKNRLLGAKTERPLIKNLEKESLFDYISDKLALRETYYNRSDITIQGTDVDINELYNKIAPYLNR